MNIDIQVKKKCQLITNCNHNEKMKFKMIYNQVLEDTTPMNTGILIKTPKDIMIKQMIQLMVDSLIDRIFDTDDDYMFNQRWKR